MRRKAMLEAELARGSNVQWDLIQLSELRSMEFAERKFSVTNADRERVRSAADPEKLQAALDEVTEPDATPP